MFLNLGSPSSSSPSEEQRRSSGVPRQYHLRLPHRHTPKEQYRLFDDQLSQPELRNTGGGTEREDKNSRDSLLSDSDIDTGPYEPQVTGTNAAVSIFQSAHLPKANSTSLCDCTKSHYGIRLLESLVRMSKPSLTIITTPASAPATQPPSPVHEEGIPSTDSQKDSISSKQAC